MVKYQKKQTECRCCGRDFYESDLNLEMLKKFEVTVNGFFKWTEKSNGNKVENKKTGKKIPV
ncbi:hypothetical protein LZ480_11825 [Solibacillus sp. MA9]|uniref:Transposase n=1 Tax=Solibacillus palustris TaxID=2908203 RepID=A0ABS9UE33_9BACL|nr:hypothetical protein [Solibacillus sp. MA9]MCH7322581.1 hypothetical protein [Solibacillus sp. MA9]